jgi:hypothetical protein
MIAMAAQMSKMMSPCPPRLLADDTIAVAATPRATEPSAVMVVATFRALVSALKSGVSGRAGRTSRSRPGCRRSTGLREPRLYPLVDFRPDALDQALGDRVLVTGTEVGVRAHGNADLGLGVAAHERTLQRAE